MLDRLMRDNEQAGHLSKIIGQIRKDHPTLSWRAMYYKVNPESMGRDAFERLCSSLGLKTSKFLNRRRTTNSYGVIRFDNLLSTMTLTGINQAWCSDITYFEINDQYYYITFILDCYSRYIVGHSTSKRLTTEETTLPALRLAIEVRGGKVPSNMIFHSDGGGQYYDKQFLKYTSKYQFRNSMCEYAYENGKAERINGIIKNNYLKYYNIKTFDELLKGVDRAVTLYNADRPHKALKYKSPLLFEKGLN